MSNTPATLTRHASQRADEMGVTARQIANTLADPEVTYDQNYRGDLRRVFKKADLAIVTNREATRVITVLWNTTTTGRTSR